MDLSAMRVSELKEKLEEKGISYDNTHKKDDLIALLQESNSELELRGTDESETFESQSLIGKIKGAIKKEESAKEENTDCYSYLEQRPYEMLDVAEREIVRSRSPEYENVEKGILVKLAERVPQGYRIVRLVNGNFTKFLEGKEYIISEENYEDMKNLTVRRKTEETKNKCCNQAKYETVKLFEVVSNG
ncbi:hypothetical protein FI615_001694 [Enterococcus faecium]|uniref:HeH/LEM domain-containing protein n=1 Tax=Enterococcus faecium TaxID=1352 RepID=UPI0019FF8DFA|nr:HeH/LEM domain-containing protein [Enterococcus faecium]EGP4894207.1 hypothetical protein [Enterococcus faecium]MBL3708355.1 hypothetical protein [Enterococcus faecium]